MTPAPTTVTVRYRPLQGGPRLVQVTSEQLHGQACVIGADDRGELAAAGHVYTETCAGSAPLGWPVVACPQHLEATS